MSLFENSIARRIEVTSMRQGRHPRVRMPYDSGLERERVEHIVTQLTELLGMPGTQRERAWFWRVDSQYVEEPARHMTGNPVYRHGVPIMTWRPKRFYNFYFRHQADATMFALKWV